MQAGHIRHRVAFDEPVTSQDSHGDELVTWTPAVTLWASVEPLTGREQIFAGVQMLAEGIVRIRLRWSEQAAQITAKWRARHNGDIYNLVSVAHLGSARREIEIMARSGVNEG